MDVNFWAVFIWYENIGLWFLRDFYGIYENIGFLGSFYLPGFWILLVLWPGFMGIFVLFICQGHPLGFQKALWYLCNLWCVDVCCCFSLFWRGEGLLFGFCSYFGVVLCFVRGRVFLVGLLFGVVFVVVVFVVVVWSVLRVYRFVAGLEPFTSSHQKLGVNKGFMPKHLVLR